jgi:hypothetical protein
MDTLEVISLPMRAPYFYPTNQAANREDKLYPKAWGAPSLLKSANRF